MTKRKTSNSRATRDAALAEALAAGLTWTAAAEQSGYSLSTVTRRHRDPGFRRRVDEIRRGRLTAISDRLQSLGTEAAETLADLMRTGESEQVRCRAALGLLSTIIRVKETVEIEGQIAELQDLLAEDLCAAREAGREAA